MKKPIAMSLIIKAISEMSECFQDGKLDEPGQMVHDAIKLIGSWPEIGLIFVLEDGLRGSIFTQGSESLTCQLGKVEGARDAIARAVVPLFKLYYQDSSNEETILGHNPQTGECDEDYLESSVPLLLIRLSQLYVEEPRNEEELKTRLTRFVLLDSAIEVNARDLEAMEVVTMEIALLYILVAYLRPCLT